MKQASLCIKINPLAPKNDQDLISPYNINTKSSRQLMKTKQNINQWIISRMIQYQVLRTNVIKILWHTVRIIIYEILGVKGWSWLLSLNYARGRTCKKMAWAVKLKLKYFLSILFRRNFVNSQLKTVTGFGLSCSCDFRPILRNIAKLIYVNLVILDVIILSFKLFISCLYVNLDPDHS